METKTHTEVVSKFMMLSLNVGNMLKSKAFYIEILGLNVATEYRIDDNNWWVSLTFPRGGATITLSRTSRFPDSIMPETMSLYFETSDISEAHARLIKEDPDISEIQDDLFGPASGVKFFILKDPDGNMIHIVQSHASRTPF
jgi:catechol 2,3-dioxygenase-like lactoylglutathione lyase family enzyme